MCTFLIEDDPRIRDTLIPLINGTPRAPVAAYADTEVEAIAWMKTHGEWKLAVLDLMLKEGFGMNVLEAFQGRNADQYVVILTNSATSEMRERAQKLGADAVFDKTAEINLFMEFCAPNLLAARHS